MARRRIFLASRFEGSLAGEDLVKHQAQRIDVAPGSTDTVLAIRITKRKDGNGVLRYMRADGSETWQKQESRHAAFFALHDLTHFAVESALGFRAVPMA